MSRTTNFSHRNFRSKTNILTKKFVRSCIIITKEIPCLIIIKFLSFQTIFFLHKKKVYHTRHIDTQLNLQHKCIPFLNFLPNMEFPIVDSSSIYHYICQPNMFSFYGCVRRRRAVSSPLFVTSSNNIKMQRYSK